MHDKLCETCARVQASPDQWEALIQVRQHVSHRRTFLSSFLNIDAAKDAIRIKRMDEGIDFFFAQKCHGDKFVDFVGKVAPIKMGKAKELMSHDTKSNRHHFKHSFSVEISHICRQDLICLPGKVSASLGNLGPLVICTKVSNRIALLDPRHLGKGSWMLIATGDALLRPCCRAHDLQNTWL